MKLQTIQYGFRNSRLVDVYITADAKHFLALKKLFIEKYGEGYADRDRCYWMGDKSIVTLYREHSALTEFDCPQQTYRIVQESWVMRTGQTHRNDKPGTPPPASSHAVMKRLLQTVCRKDAK